MKQVSKIEPIIGPMYHFGLHEISTLGSSAGPGPDADQPAEPGLCQGDSLRPFKGPCGKSSLTAGAYVYMYMYMHMYMYVDRAQIRSSVRPNMFIEDPSTLGPLEILAPPTSTSRRNCRTHANFEHLLPKQEKTSRIPEVGACMHVCIYACMLRDVM